MLTGNIDPRRPDKQQRYKPPPSSNNAAPGEDLTPDYMNILDSQKKSMHSSNNRSDRFKVVKIESTEPFKRGRWECMDFLDQSYNRIFQHNSVVNKASDTSVQTSSNGSRTEPQKTVNNGSWGSNIDLQSSMLQIFYRQNNSLTNLTDKFKSINMPQSAPDLASFNRVMCCGSTCMKPTYRNHVLRPGMVSSSLIGVKYPLELNFAINEDTADSTTLSLTADIQLSLPHKQQIYNQMCICQSISSGAVCKQFQSQLSELHNMTSEHHQFIQSSQHSAPPTVNNIQQNYPVQPNNEFVYPTSDGITSNSQNPNGICTSAPTQSVAMENIYQEPLTSCCIVNNTVDNSQYNLNMPTMPQNSDTNKTFQGECYQTIHNNGKILGNLNDSGRYVNNTNYADVHANMCHSPLNYQEPIHYQVPANSTFANKTPTYQMPHSSQLPTAINSNLTNSSQTKLNNNLFANNNGMSEQTFMAVIQDMEKVTINPIFNKESLVQISTNICENTENNVHVNNIVQNETNHEIPMNKTQQNITNVFPNINEQIQYSNITNTFSNMSTSTTAKQEEDASKPHLQQETNSNFTQNRESSSSHSIPHSNLPHPNIEPSYFNIFSGENLYASDSQIFVPSLIPGSILLPALSNQYHVPVYIPVQNLTGNNAMPKNRDQSLSDTAIQQRYLLLPHSINAGVAQPPPNVGNPNSNYYFQRQEVAACIHSFLSDGKNSASFCQTEESQQKESFSNTLDTKIEALMDLVKKHLKCAVLEDVNILKQRILMLKERIAQLEYENELLKRCDCPHHYKHNI